jgi:UDP-N-acetylmuramoyl-tripeptide--D-alanyl-D-alanine ligase
MNTFKSITGDDTMFTVNEIVRAMCGELISGCDSAQFSSFSKDTRDIKNGDFYIPLIGEKFDGHDYILDAIEKGALGFCISKKYQAGKALIKEISGINRTLCSGGVLTPAELRDRYPATRVHPPLKKWRSCTRGSRINKEIVIIEVDDTLLALQELARYNRNKKSHIKLIAVTGSVGKTSTKEMIYSVLEKGFRVLKTEGNLNNHIGLPLTLLRLNDEDVCIVEMGMNNLGEIGFLSKLAKPDIAVITNIGVAHIGNLGSQENIYKAKTEILDGLKEKGIVVVNGDDKYLKTLQSSRNFDVIKYGLENDDVEIKATNISIENETTSFYVGDKQYKLNSVGKHNIYNALCGMVIGKKLNLSEELIQEGYRDYKNEKMRMQHIHIKNDILFINDAYNANYDSMRAGIEAVAEMKAKRKIIVLGDMFELGEFSKEHHENIGEICVQNKIDILITCGKEAVHISNAAQRSLRNSVYHYDYKRDAINKLKDIINEGDIVYFKASRGMKFEELVNELIKHFGG